MLSIKHLRTNYKSKISLLTVRTKQEARTYRSLSLTLMFNRRINFFHASVAMRLCCMINAPTSIVSFSRRKTMYCISESESKFRVIWKSNRWRSLLFVVLVYYLNFSVTFPKFSNIYILSFQRLHINPTKPIRKKPVCICTKNKVKINKEAKGSKLSACHQLERPYPKSV